MDANRVITHFLILGNLECTNSPRKQLLYFYPPKQNNGTSTHCHTFPKIHTVDTPAQSRDILLF